MSRISKWKPEKTKVKVVFRLQFHATHIPPTGWDKLFISFIPVDSGKATAKTTKANVRSGTCKWGDPIYETTRLLQDIRTKQYEEKLYRFSVATGSSRSSLLGEATINLSDYADALEPSSVTLPLDGCDTGALLHVTIQLLTSKTGFREFEQQRELRERGLVTASNQNGQEESTSGRIILAEETVGDHTENVRARIRQKSKGPMNEDIGRSDERGNFPVGFDVSSNTSESLGAEKHDSLSVHEVESLKSTVSGDLGGLPLSQSPRLDKLDRSDPRSVTQGASDWVHGWASDYCADNDLAVTYEENTQLRGNLEAAETSLHYMKLEINSLQSYADNLSVEAQKFAQQLAVEMASGENLSREVAILKSECSKFKSELEVLKIDKFSSPYFSKESVGADQGQDIQLKIFRGLLLLEDKLRDMHRKTCMGFHERDWRLLGSDLEALLVVLQDLKRGTGQAIPRLNYAPQEVSAARQIGAMNLHESEKLASRLELGTDLYMPETVLHNLGSPGLSHDTSPAEIADPMNYRILELLKELDVSKAEKESLAQKMDQMECYYEALVQELEGNQRHMLVELQNLRNEHTACLYAISSSNAEMERMRQDTSGQLLRISEEKRELETIGKELERRATTAEAALKRARLNYSIAVNQLQKDLELLSCQVSSMYEANENLIQQAFEDSSLRSSLAIKDNMQDLELDHVAHEQGVPALLPHHNKSTSVLLNKRSSNGDALFEDLKDSLHMQEELYQKVEQEVCDMNNRNVFLDVFSHVLQEHLRDASAEIRIAKRTVDRLNQQLQQATELRDSSMVKLQHALDDVSSLSKHKESTSLMLNEAVLQNQSLETSLQDMASENHSLAEKVIELEYLIVEYEGYRRKYESCAAEKTELKDLLSKQVEDSAVLQSENTSLQGEVVSLQKKLDEVTSMEANLQTFVSDLQQKLQSLLVSQDDLDAGASLLLRETGCKESFSGDCLDLVSCLVECQKRYREKIDQLNEANKALEKERNNAFASLNASQSSSTLIKERYKQNLCEMVDSLSMSNSRVQKLERAIETIGQKLSLTTEMEKNLTEQQKELITHLRSWELVLEQLILNWTDISLGIVEMDKLNEELGKSELIISEYARKTQYLEKSLLHKAEEVARLEVVVITMKETLETQNRDFSVQKDSLYKLESTVADLTLQIKEKQEQLVDFDHQKVELLRLREFVSQLAGEKSELSDLLLQTQQYLTSAREKNSWISHLHDQLSEMHEGMIAADVRSLVIGIQYRILVDDLLLQLQNTDAHITCLKEKHFNVESRLISCEADKALYLEQNAELMTSYETKKSDLAIMIAQNKELLETNASLMACIEEQRKMHEDRDAGISEEIGDSASDIERLRNALTSAVEEIDKIMLLNEELEVKVLILEGKLKEQSAVRSDNIILLERQCEEITLKLSEQASKTEEYKNLSIRLNELKEKAEAEASQKKEADASAFAVQESLRIAFIKEQYENKLQELKQQLSISRKHSEEMLWKLQDAVDEIENRKKSEASSLKRNEELTTKILELETELQEALSEIREKTKAYDRMKAEMECSLISLECCKEEKEKVQTLLHDCTEEKARLAANLAILQESVSNSECHMSNLDGDLNGSLTTDDDGVQLEVTNKDIPTSMVVDSSINEDISIACSISVEGDNANCPVMLETTEDLPSGFENASQALTLVSQENFLQRGTGHLDLASYQVKVQSLKSSMDNMNKELERMKNENWFLPEDGNHFDPKFPELDKELLHLKKANEELGSMFPSFDEFSDESNALERVLALEIELADALKSKNKSSQFHSSFLRRHSDEEAVFKSFRDINELIKEMLDLKGKYTTVERELKEMQDRYSQLSLEFAEVEGERQKLLMTLKCVRSSRKTGNLSRSPLASLGEHQQL
ncbi:hypothetical protein MLD38_034569 [Melastoma candidum]|uniref:Uncharacterized protein n=1 Tax=Melastoma candidum TaxID=119954 RepID=A0ACB9MDX4_9MYRT|nr:hypothetical protein MLD38_034569 [Melastoma candidum]